MTKTFAFAFAVCLIGSGLLAPTAESAPPCANGSKGCHDLLVRHGCITVRIKKLDDRRDDRRCRAQSHSGRLDRYCQRKSTWVCIKWMN